MNKQIENRIKDHVLSYVLSHEGMEVQQDKDWQHFVAIMTDCAGNVVKRLCNDKLIQERTLYMFRGDKQYGRNFINRLTQLGYDNQNNYSGENENIIYFGTCGVVSVCDVDSECHRTLVKLGFKTINPKNDIVR